MQLMVDICSTEMTAIIDGFQKLKSSYKLSRVSSQVDVVFTIHPVLASVM